jgi:hypothetical protein
LREATGVKLMKVSILGVVVGGVMDVVSSVPAGLPFALYSTFKLDGIPTYRASFFRSGVSRDS